MKHQANAILGLRTETSLHAGVGQQTGGIDLPIQREAHTGWPCVYGSGVKGALRNLAEDMLGEAGRDSIKLVFGPDTANASEHAGALAVGDARLLLLPVRSLTGHFKWVTCPAVLDRFSRDARRLGIHALTGIEIVPPIEAKDAASSAKHQQTKDDLSPAWHQGADAELFLEEYRFRVRQHDLSDIIDKLVRLVADDAFTKQLEQQLVIVGNDLFKTFCDSATPVNAHVRLDSMTRTVDIGALWYEETLPPETLLYAPLSAAPARKRNASEDGPAMASGEVLEAVTRTLFEDHPYLQLGGNETVGMGWCRVQLALPEENN